MKNSRIIFPLLGIGMVASFYYASQNTLPVQRIDRDKAEAAFTQDAAASKALESDRFDFSGGEQRKFSKPRRNLFNQLFPPPPAPKKVAAPPVAPPPVVVVPAPAPPPMPVPVRTPSSRMPSFQVLGFLEKGDQLTAFVSLQGEIYLVKKEQLFADEFRVAELNHENITIARASGADEVSLPLSEKTGSTAISGGPASRPVTRPSTHVSPPVPRPTMPVARPDGLPAMPSVHPPIEGGN